MCAVCRSPTGRRDWPIAAAGTARRVVLADCCRTLGAGGRRCDRRRAAPALHSCRVVHETRNRRSSASTAPRRRWSRRAILVSGAARWLPRGEGRRGVEIPRDCHRQDRRRLRGGSVGLADGEGRALYDGAASTSLARSATAKAGAASESPHRGWHRPACRSSSTRVRGGLRGRLCPERRSRQRRSGARCQRRGREALLVGRREHLRSPIGNVRAAPRSPSAARLGIPSDQRANRARHSGYEVPRPSAAPADPRRWQGSGDAAHVGHLRKAAGGEPLRPPAKRPPLGDDAAIGAGSPE